MVGEAGVYLMACGQSTPAFVCCPPVQGSECRGVCVWCSCCRCSFIVEPGLKQMIPNGLEARPSPSFQKCCTSYEMICDALCASYRLGQVRREFWCVTRSTISELPWRKAPRRGGGV